MKNLSDIELVELVKQGDEESLDFLLNKYKQLASKIARSYFLVGAEDEDLMQEAMIGLYKAILKFNKDNGANFSTFAYKCITRNVQSAVKMANRKKNQFLNNYVPLSSVGSVLFSDEEQDEVNLVIPSSSLTPDEKLIEEESLKQIKEKIKNNLSILELQVLIQFLKGHSYKNIAQNLNMNSKTIDNALSRVRHKLEFLKKK